ncbi:unnamed protein product [Closterium sp. NIES-65]|nr:unnamed protein product [Closterium sp. NIES-65]CAI5979156.1 unnamed protein product [Closterium sp. NIES-65]
MVVPFVILLLSALATASSADGRLHTVTPYKADIEDSSRSHVANAAILSSSADPTYTNQVRQRLGSTHQRLRLSSRLAVPRDVPSAADDKEASPDRRALSATDPRVSAPSLSSGPNLVSKFAFMQPRDPRQITPAPPSLAPPVLPPPIAKSPPVKPPPVKPPPVKPPPVKPPPPFFQPWPINGQGIFNVLQFGARADGRTDNTDAFRRALLTACAWGKARSGYARVVVPAGGLFQIFPVNLEGPCGAGLAVQVGAKRCGDQRGHCRASQRDILPQAAKEQRVGFAAFQEGGWMDNKAPPYATYPHCPFRPFLPLLSPHNR